MTILEQSDIDVVKSNRAILIIFIGAVIGGIIYYFSESITHTAIVIGLVVLLASLYHTPIALMTLLFFFPIEGAVEASKIGAGSRLIGVLVMVSYILNRFRLKVFLPNELFPILLFHWFAMLSFFWALNQQTTFDALIPLTLNIVMIFVMVNTIKDERNFRYLMWAVFLGALVTSLMILGGSVDYAAGGEKMGRVVLTEGTNPNVLGNSILLGFIAGFYLFNERDKLMRFLFIFLGPLMMYCVLLTQNRTALGAAIAGPLVGFVFSARGKYKVRSIVSIVMILVLGMGMVFAALYTDVLTQDARQRMRETGGDLEGSGRMRQWRKSIEFLSEKPIAGWGYKNFPEKIDPHLGIRSAHNNFFAIATELGIVGLLIWFSIYFIFFIRVFKVDHPPLRWLMMSLLVFNFLIGMTSTSIIRKGYWYSLGFVLLASAVTYVEKKKEQLLEPEDKVEETQTV